MPIRLTERSRYPSDWRLVRARILRRAQGCCEWPDCGVPNGEFVFRLRRRPEVWRFANGSDCGEADPDYYGVTIVLTVAHLNHQPEDCRDENLAAWCQLHHLRYDTAHHQRNASATRRTKKGNRELFDADAT